MKHELWEESKRTRGRLENPRDFRRFALLAFLAAVFSILLLVFLDEIFGFTKRVFGNAVEEHVESTDIPDEEFDLEGQKLIEQTPETVPYY
jgi:hypothetical protein